MHEVNGGLGSSLCKTPLASGLLFSAGGLWRMPLTVSPHPKMLIQKVFHIRKSIDEAQARFSNFQNLSGRFLNTGGFARMAGGRGLWDAMALTGFQGSSRLELLPTEEKHQVLFHSTDGEFQLCGLMELLPVRDHLTEVQLTLEYEIQSSWRRALDRLLGVMDRWVNRRIMEMKRQMEDDGVPEAPSRFIPAPAVAAEPHPAR